MANLPQPVSLTAGACPERSRRDAANELTEWGAATPVAAGAPIVNTVGEETVSGVSGAAADAEFGNLSGRKSGGAGGCP